MRRTSSSSSRASLLFLHRCHHGQAVGGAWNREVGFLKIGGVLGRVGSLELRGLRFFLFDLGILKIEGQDLQTTNSPHLLDMLTNFKCKGEGWKIWMLIVKSF
ncbi:hypothetical protein ACFX19_024027 [Malus domestica]